MVTLSVRALSVTLGGRKVVDAVSAELAGGEFVGVLGPNGAGKSSLVRALLGLIPSTGVAAIDGRAVADLPRGEVARRLAYLPQGQAIHWPLPVERLVALGRLPHLGPFAAETAADHAMIAAAMARTDIADLATRPVTGLSGGERARVLLARALAVGAPALIVDEPLASLDPAHQLHVMAILRAEARAGTLVIAVLHDLTLAVRFCDRLLLLDRGRCVADGPPDRVLTADRLAAVYGVRAERVTVAGQPAIVAVETIG